MNVFERNAGALLLVGFAAGCDGSDGGARAPGDGGTDAESADATAGSTGAGGRNAAGGNDAAGRGTSGNGGASTASGGTSNAGSNSGGAAGSPAAGGSTAAGGGTSSLYVPPTTILGGACTGTPAPPSPPCSDAPVQRYCSRSEPTKVIMVACTTAGRSQCEVMSECASGWHACTATDYVARGGRDVAPNFSATNRAWLAACVRDANGTQFRNEPCSTCGQDVPYEPAIQWYCDGQVVYAGGMAGDALGIHTSPTCMRVGENDAAHGAYWTMGFSGGAPTFVMCCLDV